MQFELITNCQVIMHNNKTCGRDFFDVRSRKCIFHDNTDVKKKESQFLDKLKEYIKEVESGEEAAIYDFTEFVFPAISFSSHVFSKPAIFTRGMFLGDVDFSGAKFKSSVNFEATFYQKADFSGSHFQNVAYFERAKFCRDSKFDLAEFKLTATFHSAEFQQNISFLRATFSELANFDSAVFQGEAIFNESKFLNETMFLGADFHFFARFEKVEFYSKSGNGGDATVKGAIFSKVRFGNNASFSYSTFNCGADFTETTFQGEGQFFEVVFADEADFHGATFSGTAFFFKAQFHKGAGFISSTYEKVANFIQAEFRGQTFFSTTKFHFSVSFAEARFAGITWFPGVEFNEKALFEMTKFEMRVDFMRIKVTGELRFRGGVNSKCFHGGANFQSVSITKEAMVTFEKVDLGQVSFLDTNLERVVFRDIEWYQPKQSRWWRRKRALRDEFEPLFKEDAQENEKVAENYRQLVLNYERKRDYEAAEDFHIGEMEMRRLKQGVWMRIPYILYKWASHYGTSYVRGFIVLFALVLLFSFGFLYTGFQASEGQSGRAVELIQYGNCANPGYRKVSVLQWISDYGKACMLTLSVLTFQRERFYAPKNDVGRLLLYVSVIFLTSQAALVLLAIRRRFKR